MSAVRVAVGLRRRRVGWPGQRFQLSAGDGRQLVGCRQHAGHPVGPVGGVVALASLGAVQLPQPAPVLHRLVDVDAGHVGGGVVRRVVPLGQGDQHAADQLVGGVVGRLIDPVDQVPAVATVGGERQGPPLVAKVLLDTGDDVQGLGVLGRGRADARHAVGVDVDQHHAPAGNVGVVGRVALLDGPQPVVGAA